MAAAVGVVLELYAELVLLNHLQVPQLRGDVLQGVELSLPAFLFVHLSYSCWRAGYPAPMARKSSTIHRKSSAA
jgi:hypothetical protein